MKKKRLIDFGDVASTVVGPDVGTNNNTNTVVSPDVGTNNNTNTVVGSDVGTNNNTNTVVSPDVGTNNNTNTVVGSDVGTNNNTNTVVGSDVGTNISVYQLLEKIASQNNKPQKIQRSIYLSEDISKKFDRYGKKLGKGAKSDLIEIFLREALKNF